MAKIHLLNVGSGDCSIIQHNSDRVTMIDICGGNRSKDMIEKSAMVEAAGKPKGNFKMCARPTNPIVYSLENDIRSIWRFVLTHPDMDHMDGFSLLREHIPITCFWDTGARKEKPSFDGAHYSEDDWDDYVRVRDGLTNTQSLLVRASDVFPFANKKGENGENSDGISILAPSKELVRLANESEDHNDASYVLLYQTAGHKILFAGDAHDETWGHVLEEYPDVVANCSVLLAPHHGRKSGRSYEFLDVVNPRFTLFGCASSEHLAYDAWRYRELEFLTQNQVGNMVIETAGNELKFYIENENYATSLGRDTNIKNSQGYVYLGALS